MLSAEKISPAQEIQPEYSAATLTAIARRKWGESLDSGFQVIPDVLFRCQRILGLDALDVVILLNITTHWWEAEDLPHPRPSVIARRLGVTTRTVERRIARLQRTGFLKRLESRLKKGRTVRQFDLAGLVAKLRVVSVENLKWRRAHGARMATETDAS
jgi:hypothetical protein